MPRSPQTRWVAALVALVVFVLAAWLFGSALALGDAERTVLRVGLVVLGLLLAAALLWWLRPEAAGAAPPARRPPDDALGTLDAARARLGRGAWARPVVLVVGAPGSCKTTLVTRAGLDPVLLAGDAPPAGPGDAPPPTTAANVWLAGATATAGGAPAGGAVLAEPGGAVFADPARWRAFVRRLRAPRLAAALGRRDPAPRAAVLCVSADLFYAGGDQVERLAQMARERLAEAARALGVALPVYVVFTKADRLPQFEPWAAPLTRDEVRAPLGAALPYDPGAGAAASAGGYAERLAPRLDAAFGGLVAALAARRLELLGRESVAERRLSAYELPRELGKFAPAAARFLADVCRPLQLGAAPQLRGFYFVGARPVVVGDLAGAAAGAAAGLAAGAAPAAAPAPALASNATRAFVPGRGAPNDPPNGAPGAGAVPYGAPYGPPAARRVPQWTFLDRLFPDVVLADRGAAAAARGGTRVAALRRGLLGAGVVAAAVLAAMVARSWAGNQGLARRTAEAARAVAALPAPAVVEGRPAPPPPEALRRLDALGTLLDTLHGYQRAGVPARLGLGLWQGDAVAGSGDRVWLAGYRRQLHDAAWAALVDSLRRLPDAPRPGDDYARVYDELKTYLVATTRPDSATPEAAAPVLLASWQAGRPVDPETAALARRQFEFFARALARDRGAPWTAAGDAPLVEHTRGYLGQFAGAERIYQAMLGATSAEAPPARLAALAPQAPGVVSAPGDVPGAFTDSGWTLMQAAFGHVTRYFQGERWVVGEGTAAQAQDSARVLAELRARYRADYVERWRAWVRGLRVVPAASARDAAQKLGVLGGGQSPLLAALALAARHTAPQVDSGVAAAFQPVHAVTPPRAAQFVGEGNQQYAGALLTLQSALDQVANLPPPNDTIGAQQMAQAGQQGLLQAAQAKVAAGQLAQKFTYDSVAGPLGAPVAALLRAPIEGAEAFLRRAGTARPPAPRPAVAAGGGGPPPPRTDAGALALLNARGAALCASATPVLAKFPFNPDARDEATVAEVNALFAPGTGHLWSFYDERLKPYLEKQGERYVPRPGSPPVLSAPFVTFFNRAARTSEALYAGGAEPRLVVTARTGTPKRAIVLSQGSQSAQLGRNAPPVQFVWPSTSGRDARIAVSEREFIVFGKMRVAARATGEWALFRLVAQAAKWEPAGTGTWRAEWNAGGPVAVEFSFPNGPPVLQRGWLGGMACAPRVTQ